MKNIVFLPNHGNKIKKTRKAAKSKSLDGWSCLKTALEGDVYLFYFGDPIKKIAAIGVSDGEVEEKPNENWDWTKRPKGWFCGYKPFQMLKNPIKIEDIKTNRVLAKWWKGVPFRGSGKTVQPRYRIALERLIVNKNPGVKRYFE